MCIMSITIPIIRWQSLWFYVHPATGMFTINRKEQVVAEKKFQWSVFTNNTRMEQYVVRTDEFADFLEAIDLVRALLPETNPEHDGNGNGHVEDTSAADFC